jgi:hypothetical protein
MRRRSAFPIGDLTIEHFGCDRKNVACGVVEQVAGVRDAVVPGGERLPFRMGLRYVSLRCVRDAPSVVDGGCGRAVELDVVRGELRDQFVPSAEPDQSAARSP